MAVTQRAGVPCHPPITEHSPVLKGGFGQTMTVICLTGPATSHHIPVSLHLADSSVSFVSAISPGLLGTPNPSHTFNQRMSALLNPISQTHPPGQCQPRCLAEQKDHPVFSLTESTLHRGLNRIFLRHIIYFFHGKINSV